MNNYNATEMLAEEMMARMTAANRELDQLRAATARAEAAEAWRANVPWQALRSAVDAAFHLAKNTHDAELWAECEAVEQWIDEHEIGTKSCADIHPETQQGEVQP